MSTFTAASSPSSCRPRAPHSLADAATTCPIGSPLTTSTGGRSSSSASGCTACVRYRMTLSLATASRCASSSCASRPSRCFARAAAPLGRFAGRRATGARSCSCPSARSSGGVWATASRAACAPNRWSSNRSAPACRSSFATTSASLGTSSGSMTEGPTSRATTCTAMCATCRTSCSVCTIATGHRQAHSHPTSPTTSRLATSQRLSTLPAVRRLAGAKVGVAARRSTHTRDGVAEKDATTRGLSTETSRD
mmetsp:Transcript_19682/g.33541  ORF Transcript_19682/g.33541 Transcript_19682/m.33541 type:complete len:251 (-) Transcript_19682:263-1015(-)